MRLSLLRGLALLAAFSASLVQAQEWTVVSGDLLKEKVGYGGICGVVVEKSGDVLIDLSDKGLPSLQGSCCAPVSASRQGDPRGRTEIARLHHRLNPTGGPRMFVVLVYGAPIQASTDRGETMTSFDPKKTSHVDWCAVDWTDNKLFLTLKHESGGVLLRLRRRWQVVGDRDRKGYGLVVRLGRQHRGVDAEVEGELDAEDLAAPISAKISAEVAERPSPGRCRSATATASTGLPPTA